MWKFPHFILTLNPSLSEDAVILILSGSHGDREGISALSDETKGRDKYPIFYTSFHILTKNSAEFFFDVPAAYNFYRADCINVGVLPKPKAKTRPMPPDRIPNFNKAKNYGHLREERLKNLKFRVVDVANYLQREDTLVEHIKEESYKSSFRLYW